MSFLLKSFNFMADGRKDFMRYQLIFLAIFLSSFGALNAQITGPEQDCSNAILVCQEAYVNNQFYTGTGQNNDIARGSVCFGNYAENNSVWYRVEIQSNGQLSFDIASLSGLKDDYDFAVYNMTGLSCPDIYDGTGVVRCSYTENTDTSGLRPGATGVVQGNVGGSFPADTFLSPINVLAGETYMILIGHYFSSINNQPLPNGGFSIDFSKSTAGVIDVTPAQINQVDLVGACEEIDSIRVELNSSVLCNSIASDGSDFNIVGPSNVNITQATALNCNQWGETTEILILANSLNFVPGNHDLFVQQGSDGNTLVDACGNASPVQNVSFNVELLDADFTYTLNSSCAADTFNFQFTGQSNPIAYQWVLDGDTFTQSNFTYISQDTGTYTVELTTFSPGCSVTESTTITSTSVHVAAFFAPDKVCVGEQVDFNDATQGTPNIWQWYFEQNATSSLQNPSHIFNQAGTYQVLLVAVDNLGLTTCTDSFASIIQVAAEPELSIESPDEICQEEEFELNYTGTGSLSEIRWIIDDDTLFGASQLYALANIGSETVNLKIIDSVCGTYTLSEDIDVNETPFFDLGNDTLICPEEAVLLSSYSGANRYLWSTGEETEEVLVDTFDVFVFSRARLRDCFYSDTIFIGSKIDGCFQILMPSAFSPNGDGLNDYYKVLAIKLTDWTLQIFNRWGELVFEEDNNRFGGWDGKYKGQELEVGVYTYFVKGHTVLGDKVDQTGNFTLLR